MMSRQGPAIQGRGRRGLTMVELLVALALAGVVGSAVLRVLVTTQRLHWSHGQRAESQASARTAAALIPGEVQELDAAAGDIVVMTSSSLTYKAMTGVYVLCTPPDPGSRRVVLAADGWLPYRALDASLDSILVFADAATVTAGDDRWLHANVTHAAAGTSCPGGGASIDVDLDGVTTAELGMVTAGAPARTFRLAELRLYQDGTGDWWLGQRQHAKVERTWSATQPLVGPLSASGLALTYADSGGAPTANPLAVSWIGIAIEGRPFGAAGAPHRNPVASVVTAVALRNNPPD
jgi:prepilin-type N-terminal cleavage/methylation domain-containing protein